MYSNVRCAALSVPNRVQPQMTVGSKTECSEPKRRSFNEQRRRSTQSFSQQASRNISPSKSLEQKTDLQPKRSPASSWTGWGADAKYSDPIKPAPQDITRQAKAAANGNGNVSGSPKSSPKDDNPLMLQGGQSYLYWDTEDWKAQAERLHKLHDETSKHELEPILSREEGDTSHLGVRRPPINRGRTDVSELSDERGSASSEYDDAREENENSMKCGKCGSLSFKARKTKAGSTRLVCTKCGERA